MYQEDMVAPASNKRQMDFEAGEPSKFARADLDEQWTCSKCGNMNYPDRVFCNRRTCGAPKTEESWVCPGCGNDNFSNRIFCNRRVCGLARPGLTAKQFAIASSGWAGGKGGGGCRGPVVPAFRAQAVVSDPKTMEPGAWQCPGCGNRNYATRTVCNRSTCAMPRPAHEDPGAAPQLHQAVSAHATQQMGGTFTMMQQLMHQQAMAVAAQEGVAAARGGCGGQQQAAPEGSWVCQVCNNLNFPSRTTCNRSKCGMPRPETDGGANISQQFQHQPQVGGCGGGYFGGCGPPAAPAAGQSSPPEGSWSCPNCGNINFPMRTACNRRDCGQPRPSTTM